MTEGSNMRYRIRRKGDNIQLIIYDGDDIVVYFEGKEDLKELLKYTKIALGMQDDPRKPRADLHIVK